jgi:glycosyltransferase involved in cell wall biosynthesis
MKILVLTNLFPTPFDPLRGTFNRQQFERLGRRHEVDVITAVDFRQRLGKRRPFDGVPGVRCGYFNFFYPPRVGRALHAFCWWASLELQKGRAIRRARYDAVLASWGYPDAVGAGVLARHLGIPYVVKLHGSDLNVQANHAMRRRQITSALRGAGAVIAVSGALAARARELGADPSTTHVLYNGVDSGMFRPGDSGQAREYLGLPPGVPVVLFVGNLKRSKGCNDLLEAFPAVLSQQPDTLLVFVGEGPEQAVIAARAQALGCQAQLRFAGAVPHGDLPRWFQAASVLCLPSHNEGVPNVVLEAMACGTPVVATRVGGIPEVVPPFAGTLVEPRAQPALSGALLESLGRDWNPAAITEHASQFRWDDNIDRLESILATLPPIHAVSAGAPA